MDEEIPQIIREAYMSGCKNEAEVIGYLAAEVSRLRSLTREQKEGNKNPPEEIYG